MGDAGQVVLAVPMDTTDVPNRIRVRPGWYRHPLATSGRRWHYWDGKAWRMSADATSASMINDILPSPPVMSVKRLWPVPLILMMGVFGAEYIMMRGEHAGAEFFADYPFLVLGAVFDADLSEVWPLMMVWALFGVGYTMMPGEYGDIGFFAALAVLSVGWVLFNWVVAVAVYRWRLGRTVRRLNPSGRPIRHPRPMGGQLDPRQSPTTRL